LLGGQGLGCARGHDDINLEHNQFGRESGEPLELPLGISVFDHDVATLDVPEVMQSLEEGLLQVGISSQVGGRQETYSSDLGRLLGLGGELRADDASTHEDEKRTSIRHRMISSARTKSDWGMVRPSAFAVLRLMTN
jgi:hypothetical protein